MNHRLAARGIIEGAKRSFCIHQVPCFDYRAGLDLPQKPSCVQKKPLFFQLKTRGNKSGIYLSLLVLAGLALLPACSGESDAEKGKPQSGHIPVRTALVQEITLSSVVSGAGALVSNQEARPAFKTGGVIKRVFAEEGENVFKGQLLATLNLTEINAQVRQAEEGLEKAKRDLQRAKNLYADSIATLEQVQNATTALRLAEETIEIARFNQSYSEVRAPVNGKVLKVLLHSGEIAAPGMPVFAIIGTDKADWKIRVGLSDKDWAATRLGNAAEVTFDAFPGKTFQASVSDLAETINPQSGTFDAELSLKNYPPRLAAGLVASVRIFPESGQPSTVIPIDALIEVEGERGIVYVVRDSQYVQRTEVQIGKLYADKVEITKGVKPGTLVATSGAAYLKHGKKISIVR